MSSTGKSLSVRLLRESRERYHAQSPTQYDSFEALPDHEDTGAIGGDLGESRDELLAILREIYPPEKDKLDALAIQIERA
jgi:ASC-1-like (ASCH) protein